MQDAKNLPQIAVWAPSHNFVGYIFPTKGSIDNQKNFSLLAAEIVSLLWGTLANFNNFRVLTSLLQRRRSTVANQTLHSVWPLHGLVDYVYIFGGCCSVTEFCQVQNSLGVLQVLRCPIGSVTARQSSSGREPNFAALSTRRHLYPAGRPSRWALAHIIVLVLSLFLTIARDHLANRHRGSGATYYCNERTCPCVSLSKPTCPNFTKCYPWWLGPPLTKIQQVMYFRFCG